MEAGIDLIRQNIKRAHPTLPDEQAEELLSSWLWRADDPIPGDTAGAISSRLSCRLGMNFVFRGQIFFKWLKGL
jgi:hypothetical protein